MKTPIPLSKQARANKVFLLVVVVAFVAFVIVGLAIGPIREAQKAANRDQTVAIYGDAIANRCNKIAQLPNNAATKPLRAVILVDGDKRRHEWHDRLPQDKRAESADAVNLIICVEETFTTSTCNYTGGKTMKVKQQLLTIAALEVPSGENLLKKSISLKGESKRCPSTTSSGGEIFGAPVPYEEFYAAIAQSVGW